MSLRVFTSGGAFQGLVVADNDKMIHIYGELGNQT